MIHLARYKWFYTALGFWCFLTTWSAWGLLISPRRVNPSNLTEFSAWVNGAKVIYRLAEISAPLSDCAVEEAGLWKKQGWNCAGGGADLAPSFLGLPPEYAAWISPILQLRIFRRQADWKLTGYFSLPSQGRTYEWTVDLPENSLLAPKAGDLHFPLNPPSGAKRVFKIQTGQTESLLWSLPTGLPKAENFRDYFTANGFSGRLLSSDRSGETFLLRKGTAQLLAVVNIKKNNVVLFSIP